MLPDFGAGAGKFYEESLRCDMRGGFFALRFSVPNKSRRFVNEAVSEILFLAFILFSNTEYIFLLFGISKYL